MSVSPPHEAAPELGTGDPSNPGARRPRRWLLGAAGTAVAAGATTLVVPGAAALEASGGKVRRVKKRVAVTWDYDRKSGRTTVTKWRTKRVSAKFSGAKVYERNAKGAWERVPYVWDKKKRALVYDRRLHLSLMKDPPKKGKGGDKPDPKPAKGTTKIAKSARSVSPYVGTSMAWHLARRASFGPSPTLLAEITKAGPSSWLERQLRPSSIPDPVADKMLGALSAKGREVLPVGMAIRYVHDALDKGLYNGAPVYPWQQSRLVVKAHIVRALWSKRQLLTVMEDFWGNHFNVPFYADSVAASREHLAATIRARAFGRFSDLLTAVTLHPAMLTSLSNRDSDKDHPNENLGRELLELHTVGVDSPYGEAGVLNSSRILTGLSVSSDSEEFSYKDWRHWTGPVKVLGFQDANRSAAGGLDVAKRYLLYLARHKDTARHICRKLAVRFVSDVPSNALVEKLAGVYVGSDTEIAPVLRALFSSSEFANSAGAKTHRPFERLMAAVRLLEFAPASRLADTADAVDALQYRASEAGHEPFGWAAPNGFPDVTGAWLSTGATLQSWNGRLATVAGWWPERKGFSHNELSLLLPYTVKPWNFPSSYTFGDVVQAVARRMFGLALPTDHRDAVCAFLGVKAATTLDSRRWLMDDGALNRWVALLLDSPYGLMR